MEKPCTYGKAHDEADDDDDDRQNKMLHYNRDSIKTLTRLHFNAYKSNRGLTYIDIAMGKGEGYKVRSLSLSLSRPRYKIDK